MAKSLTKQSSVVQTIDAFLSQVKTASARQKAAEAESEAGGYDGGTTHPVKNVDDRLETAVECSRSSENAADVKKDVEISVDSTSESINKGQDETNMNLGMHQSATGEDSSIETSSAKGGKEDASEGDKGPQGRGKTTHPARTDNESLQGGKYAAARKVLGLIKAAEDPGRDLIARIAVEANGMLRQQAQKLAGDGSCCGGKPVKKEEHKPGETVAKEEHEPGEATAKEAAEAGQDLASILAAAPAAEKQAVHQAVVESLAYTIQEARNRAVKTAQFCKQFYADLAQKQAAEHEPPQHKGDGGNDADGGSDVPPVPGGVPGAREAVQGMGPGGGGGDEDALIEALLGGHGGAGGAGGAASGAPGGAQSLEDELSPEDLQMLQKILEDIQSQGGAGGAPGGAAGGGPGGLPPAADAAGGAGAPKMASLLEALEAKATAKAAHILRQKQAGAQPASWRPKTAAEAQRYQAMSKYVSELLNS